MTQAELIERIVQEVVRRLRAMPAALASGADDAQVLRVDQRVVSVASVGDKLHGVKQLVVNANALITPLLRDELRNRKIALVRENQGAAK